MLSRVEYEKIFLTSGLVSLSENLSIQLVSVATQADLSPSGLD